MRSVTRASNNQLVWRWDNTEPFGSSAPDENPSGLGIFTFNLRFPGQYFDAETGNHYNYFRDYDSSTGILLIYRNSGTTTFTATLTENLKSGRPWSICTRVDLPEPEGPETIRILEVGDI